MRDTVTKQTTLSPDAQRLYWRLMRWWLTRGEWLWSRRDIHQRLRSGTRYRRVADLDAPIGELLRAGVLRHWSWQGLVRRERSPWYALVEPQPKRGRLRWSIPAPPAAPLQDAGQPHRLSDTEEVAWRVASFSRQYHAAGRVIPAPARPDRILVDGCCVSCGEPSGQPVCSLCERAMQEAVAEAQSWGSPRQ
jgi:hypothetical protein